MAGADKTTRIEIRWSLQDEVIADRVLGAILATLTSHGLRFTMETEDD